jgi:hypothetical protein
MIIIVITLLRLFQQILIICIIFIKVYLYKKEIIYVYSLYNLDYFLASDGQLVFLHPLNIKMLYREYGMYHLFPGTIEASVLELEEVTQTEEIRRKYRYLGHLPIGCEYLLCEIDMSSLVSVETMRAFSTELNQRQMKRNERMKPKGDKKSPVFDTLNLAQDTAKYQTQHRLEPKHDEDDNNNNNNNNTQSNVVEEEVMKLRSSGGSSYARAARGILFDPLEDPPLSTDTSSSSSTSPRFESVWNQNKTKTIVASTPLSDSPSTTTKSYKNKHILLSTSNLLSSHFHR